MENRRIFTFGCSFTDYVWPTWADIILYENSGYNFGLSGAGFDCILYRILEADRKYVFTPDDLIIVIFSTPIRWDVMYYNKKNKETTWGFGGQVITSNNKDYLDSLFTIDGLIYKSFYDLYLIDNYLKNKKLNFLYGSINNIYDNLGNYFEHIEIDKNTENLIEFVRNSVPITLQDFHNYIYKSERNWLVTKLWKNGNMDYHLRPRQYYNCINDVLLKHVDIEVKMPLEFIDVLEKKIDDMEDPNEPINEKELQKYFGNRSSRSIYL